MSIALGRSNNFVKNLSGGCPKKTDILEKKKHGRSLNFVL